MSTACWLADGCSRPFFLLLVPKVRPWPDTTGHAVSMRSMIEDVVVGDGAVMGRCLDTYPGQWCS